MIEGSARKRSINRTVTPCFLSLSPLVGSSCKGHPMLFRLAEANKAVSAALAHAEALGICISVSVCNSQGHLVAHQRMDGTFAEASRASIGKAVAAAEWGRPSGEFFEGLVDRPPRPVSGAPNMRRRGGLLIIRCDEVEGAVGVSGGRNNEEDEECATAAI